MCAHACTHASVYMCVCVCVRTTLLGLKTELPTCTVDLSLLVTDCEASSLTGGKEAYVLGGKENAGVTE